jgi:2-polyprenyl-6-methoxyphenol hydroxylase-like FAD-dependent oxidoreductase
MERTVYDAIVVGARVAGAATGMLLARAGLDVLVVDRDRYGSDILSTHALMRGGVLQLCRWGLLDEIIEAGTPAVRRTVVRYGDSEETVEIKPQPGCEALYAPRRTLLDRVLADASFRAGADVRFGTTVTGLLRGADGRTVTGITGRDRTGRHLDARAPIVIGADGGRSLVAREAGADAYVTGRHASAFLVTWYSGVEADGYQWLYGHTPEGGARSAGIIPTNGGQVCAWVAVPSAIFSTRRPEQHFHDVMAAIAPDWGARLAAARRHGPVRGFPGRPAHLRRPWGPGWALVGDAGYFRDPITAHGITDGLRDAELLARAVIAGAADPAEVAAQLADYQRTRDRLSLPLLEVTDRVASYRWSMGHLRDLLLNVSAAMRPEVAHLQELDNDRQPVAV